MREHNYFPSTDFFSNLFLGRTFVIVNRFKNFAAHVSTNEVLNFTKKIFCIHLKFRKVCKIPLSDTRNHTFDTGPVYMYINLFG